MRLNSLEEVGVREGNGKRVSYPVIIHHKPSYLRGSFLFVLG